MLRLGPEWELKIRFPNLQFGSFAKTSEETTEYNCIAWAAGEDDRVWWPDAMGQRYWPPPPVPRESTLPAFIEAFASLGYIVCDSGELEEGFEKVVIYCDGAHRPTHAARQTVDGEWTSKLGPWFDIRHKTPEDLNGSEYGKPVQFLKRSRK